MELMAVTLAEDMKAERGVVLNNANGTLNGGNFHDMEIDAFAKKMSLSQYASIRGIVEHANINILLN